MWTKLLDQLNGIERVTAKEPVSIGSYQELNGYIHRVTGCRRQNADDWFAEDEFEVTLMKPWRERNPVRSKVVWLEDQLFPRIG